MSVEFEKADMIEKFNIITECLKFPDSHFRELNIFLSYLYVSTEQMKPFGYWYHNMPDRAYNSNYSQRDLKILIQDFPEIQIDRTSAVEIWDFLGTLSIYVFLTMFSDKLKISLVDVVCSILETAYSSRYAAILNLYLVLYCGNCDYEWYISLYDRITTELDKKNNIGNPLSEESYSYLFNAIYHSCTNLTHETITPGNAIELSDLICNIATSKKQRLELFYQYKELSKDTESDERYILLAKDVAASDFIIAQDSIGEAEIECNMLFGRVFNRRAKRIFVVNPSIELIRLLNRKCKEVNNYRDKLDRETDRTPLQIYVVTDTDIKAKLLRTEFKNIIFFSYDKFLGLKSVDSIYFSATDKNTFKKLSDILDKIVGLQNEESLCSIVIGDTSKKDLLNMAEKYNLCITRIDSIPSGITDTDPKKKSVIYFMINKVQNESISLREYSLCENGSKEMILSKEVFVSKSDLFSDASFSNLLKERFVRSPVYNKSLEMIFSNELSIFYKCYSYSDKADSYRIIAFLKENIKEGSKAKSGKKISSSEKEKRLHCKEYELSGLIEKWLIREYVLDSKVCDDAIRLIKEKSPHKSPMSFRSYWLIKRHLLYKTDVELLNALDELAFENHIAGLIVGEASGKDFENAILKYLSHDNFNLYLEALEEFFEFAKREKLYEINPITEIFHIKRKEKADFDSIRSAMTKKTFSRYEESKLVKRLINKANSDPYELAVLLELFTGLSANEIAALKVKNFEKRGSGECYLTVYSALKKENGECKLIVHKKKEKHRRTPIIPLVAKFFCTADKDKEGFLLTKINSNEPLDPWKISETLRKVIKEELDIKEDLIILPDKDGKGKTTDLNVYYGNLLRSNYRYQLINICKMEEMECDYLLGNQRKAAYGKNYCDFSNKFTQLRLYKKLLRWEAHYLQIDLIPETKRINVRGIHLSKKGTRVAISAQISVNDTTRICVTSKDGISGTVYIKRGEQNENKDS